MYKHIYKKMAMFMAQETIWKVHRPRTRKPLDKPDLEPLDYHHGDNRYRDDFDFDCLRAYGNNLNSLVLNPACNRYAGRLLLLALPCRSDLDLASGAQEQEKSFCKVLERAAFGESQKRLFV